MRVLPRGSVKRRPGFKPAFGDQHVESEHLITDQVSKQLVIHSVHFFDGAKTKLHTHSAEQVLYCLRGKGAVGTETDSWDVEAGDVVYIPVGERHWHGAASGENFTHLSINIPCEIVVLE